MKLLGTLLSRVCQHIKLLGDFTAGGAGACRAVLLLVVPLLLLVLVLILILKHAPSFGHSGSSYI